MTNDDDNSGHGDAGSGSGSGNGSGEGRSNDDAQPTMPAGPPEWVTIDGILDGRVKDGPAIARAVARLNKIGVCEFSLEQDGGKYSLLPANERVPGSRFDADAQAEMLGQLQAIAAATKGAVESTLRCTMVFDSEVAETLFRAVAPPPAGDGVDTLTRMRPVTAGDKPDEIQAAPPWQSMLRRKEVVLAIPLLIVAFGLMAWRSGLVDALLAANAAGVRVELGPFDGLLDVELENHWGAYEVTLRRGADYPKTSAEWDGREAGNVTEADKLRDTMVREGQDVWLQLRDADDNVLAQTSVSLRPFVTDANTTVVEELPGRMTASQLALSMTKYEKKKN